jgi:hypothetical protein
MPKLNLTSYLDQSPTAVLTPSVSYALTSPFEILNAPRVHLYNPINGTDQTDALKGSDLMDIIHGGGGSDFIAGNAGNDLIYGDDGSDMLFGGTGADTIYGGEGDDIISGGNFFNWDPDDGANDKLYGGSGNDVIWGLAGNDLLVGGTGQDMLKGGEGNDVFKFALGDSGMTTDTADHILDFKQDPGLLGSFGDKIEANDYVMSHETFALSGSYGSIEAAGEVANNGLLNGSEAGSALVADQATGNAYLFMDMDGDHKFETGIILEHGGNWDVAHMTNHDYLFTAENPLHNGVLPTGFVANAPIIDVSGSEPEGQSDPETIMSSAADPSDPAPQATLDTQSTVANEPGNEAGEGSPVGNADLPGSDTPSDANTPAAEGPVENELQVGSFWDSAAELATGQDVTENVPTSQFDARPMEIATELTIDITSTDHGVEFSHFVDTFVDTDMTALEPTPSYFDAHQYLNA